MVYQVLDKDTIRIEILPHLSVAKRGFQTTSCLIEVVNSILYKLKTGCQWYLLPVRSLFSDVVLSHKTIFGHFRKWCKNGEWEYCWTKILEKYKSFLDLSSTDLDGYINFDILHGRQNKKTNCPDYQRQNKSQTIYS